MRSCRSPLPARIKSGVPVSRCIALTVVAIAGLAQKVWMIWLLVQTRLKLLPDP